MTTDEAAARQAPTDHRLLLYAERLGLVRAIGEFAAQALERGGAAVILAGKSSLLAAEQWVRLVASAPDLEARLVLADRDDVIARLAGSQDPASRFETLLDHARARLPSDAEPVYIYGDLVAALWERGDIRTAISIEEVVNRMAARTGQSILCAYPQALADSSDFSAIGACHTSVAPTPPVPEVPGGRKAGPEPAGRKMIFPAAVPACRAVRRFVHDAAESSGLEPCDVESAELVSSELAANAIRHAHSVFTVEVSPMGSGVRVAVADEGAARRQGDEFSVDVAHGLGIVSALCADWGIADTPAGKVVWADLPPS